MPQASPPQRPAASPQQPNIEVSDMPVPRMSPSLGRFAPAFVRVQSAIQPIIKNHTNPAFKGPKPVTYADLASILEEVLPILSANGFGIMQFPSTENGSLALMSMLIHESGEFVSATMPLLLQKADPQGEGSAISYGRRYAACAILGIRTVDDDGNAASDRAAARNQRQDDASPPPPPEDQPPLMEGWADITAQMAAHDAAAAQVDALMRSLPPERRRAVAQTLKPYQDEHGWPMTATALTGFAVMVAKAQGEATASAGQEQPETPAPSDAAPDAAAPVTEAPSAPGEAPGLCPWCEKPVEKGKPSVITGGKGPDDPAVRWHKDCYSEKENEDG